MVKQNKVLDLLKDESRWGQRHFAFDKSGCAVLPYAEAAVCWCIKGAVGRVYDTDHGSFLETMDKITLYLLEHYPKRTKPDGDFKCPIANFNDHPDTTHAEVLAMCQELDI